MYGFVATEEFDTALFGFQPSSRVFECAITGEKKFRAVMIAKSLKPISI